MKQCEICGDDKCGHQGILEESTHKLRSQLSRQSEALRVAEEALKKIDQSKHRYASDLQRIAQECLTQIQQLKEK